MTDRRAPRARRPTSETIPMPRTSTSEILKTDPDGVYARANVARFIKEQNK